MITFKNNNKKKRKLKKGQQVRFASNVGLITLSITTVSIMTFSIKCLYVTL